MVHRGGRRCLPAPGGTPLLSHPSSSPQELWSFLLPRCPLRKPLFLYTSLSTLRRPSFQPRAHSPTPSTTCQGFRGKLAAFSGPSDWRVGVGRRARAGGPLRKSLCCLRLLGQLGVELGRRDCRQWLWVGTNSWLLGEAPEGRPALGRESRQGSRRKQLLKSIF